MIKVGGLKIDLRLVAATHRDGDTHAYTIHLTTGTEIYLRDPEEIEGFDRIHDEYLLKRKELITYKFVEKEDKPNAEGDPTDV